MRLGNLLQGLKNHYFKGDERLDVTQLAYHTDQVKPGCCFVAIRGLKADGHRFVAQAIQKGAKVVIVEEEVEVPRSVSKVVVEDSRDALARLAALFYKEPTKRLRLVGITGTNGKTTTAGLIESIWRAANLRAGMLTTVSYRWNHFEEAAIRTTPEALELQRMFSKMVQEGVTDCVMEVTSHAIDLKRVVGCHFDGAIFTNLSEEHLDYHKDMENYFAAKARLFRERLVVSEKKSLWAVLNWEDPYGRTLAGGLPAKVWRFSRKSRDKVEVTLSRMEASWKGLKLEVKTPEGRLTLSSPLIGAFNVSNILAAVTAALAMEIPLEQIALGVASFEGIAGRLERIPAKGFEVFVDYAHTPDALKNVLSTLRGLQPKRLITVFGCGGNRDRLKRPMMGKVVEDLSDVIVVTSDNPREEEPGEIIREILHGFQKGKEYFAIEDRREAIAKGLQMATAGDCVLIAGKGHETYQEIKGVRRPFDDREVAKEILNGV